MKTAVAVAVAVVVAAGAWSWRTRHLPVLVVSLKRHQHRRRRLAAQASGVTFIDAVDGRVLRDDGADTGLTRGEVGCFLTHVGIWLRVAAGRDDVVMVLEDDADVRLPAQWPDVLAAAGAAPAGWDVLFLGHNNQGNQPGIREPDGDVHGTHAMLLTRAGAQKLLDRYAAMGLADCSGRAVPLDVWMSRAPGLRRYCVLPSMIPPFDIDDSETQRVR